MCVLRGKLAVASAARMSAARAPCASGYDFRTSASQPLIRGRFALFAETDATLRAFRRAADEFLPVAGFARIQTLRETEFLRIQLQTTAGKSSTAARLLHHTCAGHLDVGAR